MRLGLGSAAALACTLFLAGHAPPPPELARTTEAPTPSFDPVAAVEGLRHEIVPGGAGLRVGDERYAAEFSAEGFTFAHRGASGQPFSLQTERVDGVPAHQADWQAGGNRAERDVAPGIAERVTARDGRLEWDFVLAHPPAVAGDLRIEASVEARGPPTRVGSGWAWPAGKGRAVKMGELVVLDANGAELYRALPAVRGEKVLLNVPAAVLSDASYPVTIDPVISAEFPASDPSGGPASGAQNAPAVAFDGTNFLAVWTDYSNGENGDIRGARVSTSGTLLDEFGIAISTAIEDQEHPAVAFDGTNYLVVWEDNRSFGHDVYGTRISPAGAVLSVPGFAISTASGMQIGPAVAFNGSRFLVVWEDWRTGDQDIYGTRVLPAGTVQNPNGIAISTAEDWQRLPQVASDGANFLVVWEDWREGFDTWGSGVTDAGVVQQPSGLKISDAGGGSDPAVAPDGMTGTGKYLVVWGSHDDDTGRDIRGRFVTAGVLGPAPIPISTNPADQFQPAVTYDGTNFMVVWNDERPTTGSTSTGRA